MGQEWHAFLLECVPLLLNPVLGIGAGAPGGALRAQQLLVTLDSYGSLKKAAVSPGGCATIGPAVAVLDLAPAKVGKARVPASEVPPYFRRVAVRMAGAATGDLK